MWPAKIRCAQDGNFRRYRTGRDSTDYVTNIKGQMNVCVECGIEYLMEDALREQWHLYQGHCKKCGTAKAEGSA